MKKRVLFVCNGNVFRSLAAEYAFKKYLNEKGLSSEWKVGSAGIRAGKKEVRPEVKEKLENKGINEINNSPKKIDKKLIKDYDAVIAMSKEQEDYVKKELGYKNVLLFSELATGKKREFSDVSYNGRESKKELRDKKKKVNKKIDYIFEKIPELFRNVNERFYLFRDFAEGKVPHRNRYPFMKLHETNNTLAFMSIDIPQKEDGHILVIPKKRYEDFSEIPKNIMLELRESIRKIGKAVEKNHGGYNLLLNNGKDAGQYIYHVHFHIIPRKGSDGISIEEWANKNLSKKEFRRINKKIKRQIDSVK